MFSVRLSSCDCPGHVTVALHGELDLVDASDVALALAAASSREPLVIVDLAGLSFIDASGVAALARGRDYACGGGGELLLSSPREQVRKMLAIVFPAGDFFVSPNPAEPPVVRDVSDPLPDVPAPRTGGRLRAPSHGPCHCCWA